MGKIIAGIDEAGLGPMLGPLCFGFCSFEVQDDIELWSSLRTIVAKEKRIERRLAVNDSKKIYSSSSGFDRLEETALAFYFALHGRLPENLEEFLSNSPISPGKEVLDRHPWYRDRKNALPRQANRKNVLKLGERLRKALEKRSILLRSAGSRAVPEGELNDSFQETTNKATTHFLKCAEAIRWLVENHLTDGGEIWVDRHGMRQNYAPSLSRLFPTMHIWILEENRHESYYRLQGEEGSIQIAFVEKGDGNHFATALASIFAKYTRELFMEVWNRYFQTVAPAVRPTAGYYNDAQRYLNEAREHLLRANIPMDLLVRQR